MALQRRPGVDLCVVFLENIFRVTADTRQR
jgi:hypothetical protein